MNDNKSGCVHQYIKEVSDEWGTRQEEWCKKHKQLLAGQTCNKCPDCEEAE